MTREHSAEVLEQMSRNMLHGRWTPYHLEVLLHHYCSLAAFPRHAAPAYPECLRTLRLAGIMERGSTAITMRGAIFVGMLLQTPVPKENPPG